MKILICPDKFKGSLTAAEVIEAVARGVSAVHPQATILTQALADGGEGSLEIIRQLRPLKEHRLEVTGPLRRPVTARYLMGEGIAYVESAEACGLHLVPKHRRDPGFTTTIGVGQLIEDAQARGAHTINLFLGGSATNDGGAGMAAALGYTFHSDRGNDFVPSGQSLGYVTRIDRDPQLPSLTGLRVRAICDVSNPLLGPGGATYVFAKQKGATTHEVEALEKHMGAFSKRVASFTGRDFAMAPGAGAAGGLGFGALAFLGAEVTSGSEWLMDAVGLAALMRDVDLVITGEGQLDAQTLSGKVVARVGELAASLNKPAWVVCGVNRLPPGQLPPGVEKVYSLASARGVTVAQAIANAASLIERVVASALREGR